MFLAIVTRNRISFHANSKTLPHELGGRLEIGGLPTGFKTSPERTAYRQERTAIRDERSVWRSTVVLSAGGAFTLGGGALLAAQQTSETHYCGRLDTHAMAGSCSHVAHVSLFRASDSSLDHFQTLLESDY